MSDNAPPAQVPHFQQVAGVPVFTGTGPDDLVCACAGSVLVRGHRPGTLLAIAFECAGCGTITTTPALPDATVPPFGAHMVARQRLPVPASIILRDGMVLIDRDELTRRDALCDPRPLPATPLEVTAGTAAALAADYDRMTGGRLAADRDAVRPGADDLTTRLPKLPLAWAFTQLAPGLERPGWWCMAQDPDAVATLHLGVFRLFSAVWSGHPLFAAMCASVAAEGFSTHAMALFAAAQHLATTGNRVRFAPPAPGQTVMDTCYIETSPTERIAVVMRRFDRFDWPGRANVDVAVTRAAAIDALIASQARINARRPGILVLSVGAVHRDLDQVIIAGLGQALAGRWRRHRGLIGVALILPKIFPTQRTDQAAVGWTFLPDTNPHYAGDKARVAPPPGAVGATR